MNLYSRNNQGYLYGRSQLESNFEYELSRKFIKEYLMLDDSIFSHMDNCYYLENYCYIESRGGHQQGKHLFYNNKWNYSYHGTFTKNVKSIIKFGLKKPGSHAGNNLIKSMHGMMQKPESIDFTNGERYYTLGRRDINKLYRIHISEEEIQFVCFEESSCVLHALLIKVHDRDPHAIGGEDYKVKEILDGLAD
ncbi:9149_t:CDS:2 [Funneliformis geosporum]|uniref:11004_t:CDS:1 n=1 Tax=Funneliformis geosporum TaxID=1117311 RepID=A0A9W4SPB9_9GLOM|nr:11004_t:CDS:2 [Funneliformis geosporum]CAI2181389.1 9149_t:CDS:2 [Funneliformis geosporum]